MSEGFRGADVKHKYVSVESMRSVLLPVDTSNSPASRNESYPERSAGNC